MTFFIFRLSANPHKIRGEKLAIKAARQPETFLQQIIINIHIAPQIMHRLDTAKTDRFVLLFVASKKKSFGKVHFEPAITD